MRVCASVHMCICARTCVRVCMLLCMCACVRVCMRVHGRAYTCVCTSACVRLYVCTSACVYVYVCAWACICARVCVRDVVRSSLQPQVTASLITCLFVTLCGFAAGSSTSCVDQSFLVPPRRHSGPWGREREKGPSAGLQEYSLCACVGHRVLPVRARAAGACELPVSAPHVLPVARGGSCVPLPSSCFCGFTDGKLASDSRGRGSVSSPAGVGAGARAGAAEMGGGRSFYRDPQQRHVPESAVR